MRIHPLIYGVLVLFVFLGTILGFQVAGVWSVSGKLTADGDAVQPSAMDVNTIKGWMTLEQITVTYGVPLAEILEQFNLPRDTAASTAIKDLESDLFSVIELRAWLLDRLGTDPLSGTITASMPESPPVTPSPSGLVTTDRTINGTTTFQQLLDWGISRQTIQAIVAEDLPSPSTTVKDFITQKGLEFSPVKNSLQKALDQVK
jgi:hypothetical protein